ncbi:MAG: 23S rRNA (guanosine(2251)-2'-O)-methyltransferase RlmB [Christensenellaceae bacterium]|nr:23S rRNA (guanosine(2251)-2'-O)-methyltransferase RlmB [Christensenellaceae bacterium]
MANKSYRDGRGINDRDSERIVGFREGQPVYKRGSNRDHGTDKGKIYGGKSYDDKPYGDKHRVSKPHGDKLDGRKYYSDKPNDGERRRKSDHPLENSVRIQGKPKARRPYPDRYTPPESRYSRREAQPFSTNRPDRDDKRFVKEGKRFVRDDRHIEYAGKRFEREEKRFELAVEMPTQNDERELPNIIMGRNPVKEAIKSGRSIDRILVTKEHDGSLGEIIGLARDLNLVIREVDRVRLDEICMPFGHNGKPGNHQGIVAEIPGVEYAELEDILEYAEIRNEKPFVILLDGIEDPHNLGSIIRSAECAGVHGVVITKRRSAPVTAAVVKTSAGAAEHMRIARVVNLSAAIDTLKENGLWIAGADMTGKSMYETDMKGGFALVIGSEGSGLSKLVKEKCDFLVSVPIKGNIDSLNAAVAAAVIMFEKNRQDSII